MAHDLLGIVTIIQGFAALLPRAPSRELRDDHCRRIQHACRRMVELIDSSHAVGSQSSAELSSIKRDVDLAAFLGECLAGQTLNADKKGVALSLAVSAQPSPVAIDPASVERILDNLLDNAIKFSRARSSIKLTARVSSDALELEVEDEGPGIPEEELSTLFNPYQTGSARPTGGERSTGLGLSIVRELVQAQRGALSVRSEVGRGSTFAVHLPLDGRRPEIVSGTDPEPSPAFSLAGRRWAIGS